MCGILGILEFDPQHAEALRAEALRCAKLLRHRGPDWSGIYADDHAILAHERLSIVDVETGAQPLYDTTNGNVLAVNGEIYNHTPISDANLSKPHDWQTKSDCECLLYLYDEHGPEFVNLLNGIFAFVLYDKQRNTYMIARDHIGIVPLYMGWDDDNNLFIASEMKALTQRCKTIREFPPGHYYMGDKKEFVRYYNPNWAVEGYMPTKPFDVDELRNAMEAAVIRQLMCDVPYGLLISGGLDSSVISAIAAKYSNKRVESGDADPAWWPQMHSFSIGLHGSPDLAHARKVADYIGTIHHEVHFTVQEGIDAIRDVIYQVETFDTTTIRAATPMYLLARTIKAMGIKMVLSGEGADEIFGGYLYFHKAPNAKEFHEETLRKISKLNMYDCLRANKSTAAWGLEARVPFLDKEFLDVAMNIDPAEKMCTDGKMEKHILREAFKGYIPDEILWRQKEQFSDGVGYSWIDTIKEMTDNLVSDAMMADVELRFPVKTPLSKEQYYYRTIFEEHFPNASAIACVPVEPSIACSTPTALAWDEAFKNMADPSGRAIAVHAEAVDHI